MEDEKKSAENNSNAEFVEFIENLNEKHCVGGNIERDILKERDIAFRYHQGSIANLRHSINELINSINSALASTNVDITYYCENVITKEKINNLQNLLQNLQTSDLQCVCKNIIDKIFNLIANFKFIFSDDYYSNRDFWSDASTKFTTIFNELKENVVIVNAVSKITLTSYEIQDFANVINRARLAEEKFSEMSSRGNSLISQITNDYTNLGIGIYGKAFSEEAEKYETQSWIFLVVTAVFAVGIGLFSWFLLSEVIHTPYMDISNAISWQGMIYRLIIFSTLSYLLVFCAKNYSNMKHNATINKHRQNALATFTAFTETQQNKDVREKITLLAAYCIFGHQTTGFLKGNKDDDNIINIWSIIESVIAKK